MWRMSSLNFPQFGIIIGEVDATYIPLPKDFQWFLRNAVVDKVVLDSFTLRHDVGGACAGDAVGEDKDFLRETCSSRKNQTGKGMHTDRHATRPCRYH